MGCDLRQGRGRRHPQISIHASRMGCDCNHCGPASWPSYFNPRIPYGMRLFDHSVLNDAGIFQSTHPVWDATSVRALLALRPLISIHASRMGCDAVICHCRPLDCDFNPRIPYGMRRWTVPSSVFSVLFQSTHPVWDATWAFFDWGLDPAFQSTHPVWDATQALRHIEDGRVISIHASRMGCDGVGAAEETGHSDFNPRIPYGMRPRFFDVSNLLREFQSTHPVWDATPRSATP